MTKFLSARGLGIFVICIAVVSAMALPLWRSELAAASLSNSTMAKLMGSQTDCGCTIVAAGWCWYINYCSLCAGSFGCASGGASGTPGQGQLCTFDTNNFLLCDSDTFVCMRRHSCIATRIQNSFCGLFGDCESFPSSLPCYECDLGPTQQTFELPDDVCFAPPPPPPPIPVDKQIGG